MKTKNAIALILCGFLLLAAGAGICSQINADQKVAKYCGDNSAGYGDIEKNIAFLLGMIGVGGIFGGGIGLLVSGASKRECPFCMKHVHPKASVCPFCRSILQRTKEDNAQV